MDFIYSEGLTGDILIHFLQGREYFFFIIFLSKFNQEKKKYIGGYILQQYGKLDRLLFQAQATQDLRGFGSFQDISHERLVKTDKQSKNNPDGCASLSYKAIPSVRPLLT